MMRVAGKTDKGLQRNENEDAFKVLELENNSVAAVVCDGMGGEQGGKIASELACEVISQKIKTDFVSNMDSDAICKLLHISVNEANASIYSKATLEASLDGMGTTVVAAIVSNNTAHIVHMGDSRAYLYSEKTANFDNEKFEQVTKDHSIVQDMIEKGVINQEEARNHPKKNYITRAVGITRNPDMGYKQISFQKGQKLLLCTDGLTNYCDEQNIIKHLKTDDIQTSCDNLIRCANESGGLDNITVVIINDC